MDNEERLKLTALIREKSVPHIPEIPSLPPEWEEYAIQPSMGKISGIKAVLFDVYGTLFSSGAGDIGSFVPQVCCERHEPASLQSLARQHNSTPEALRSFFVEKVKAIHNSLSEKTSYPEVHVDKIWDEFLILPNTPPDKRSAREFALRYELAVNPVYPMPGALETITALKEAGFVLGIISNAQFFTPLLFDAFFGKSPGQLGFDPGLLFWSFEHNEAKPSPRLYGKAVKKLESMGIKANECVFIGNDMLSDIYGAKNCGFHSLLFAGDKRSLRLREGENRVKNIKPLWVIRTLDTMLHPGLILH